MKKFFVIDLILFSFIVGAVMVYVADRSEVDDHGKLINKVEQVKECPTVVPVTL